MLSIPKDMHENLCTTMNARINDSQSPHRLQYSQNLIDQVIATYANIRTLHPVLQTLFRDIEPKNAFFAAVNREKDLIQSRSQDLGDHEITKYQKAFITMMEDEKTKSSAGVLELFLYEMLGFKKSETRLQMEAEILSYFGMKQAVDQGMT